MGSMRVFAVGERIDPRRAFVDSSRPLPRHHRIPCTPPRARGEAPDTAAA